MRRTVLALTGPGAGPPGTVSGGGGGDVVVSTGHIVVNDSGSTWNQEAGWVIRAYFLDGVVTSSHDLIVRLDSNSTEFTTQVMENKTYASGCVREADLLFRIPANTMLNGNNAVSVLARVQARNTTSGLANGDISGAASLAPKLRFTSTRDYSNNADGSGTFDAIFNDYFNSGNPHHMEFNKGPVARVFRVTAVAKDTTGGAAHAGGLYGIFYLYAFEAAGGGLLYGEAMPAFHMGDIDNSDPDVRRFDVDFYLGGAVVAGASNGDDAWSDQFLPYYSKAFASDYDGRPFYSASSKKPPFRNVVPDTTWAAGNGGVGLKVLPPIKKVSFNSGSPLYTYPSYALAQTIATAGGNKGQVNIQNESWLPTPNGLISATFEFDSAPGAGGEIVAGRVYHLATYGGTYPYYYVYATRNDAGADTNRLMQGSISAGTNVVIKPAHGPMSVPAGARYWGTTGERTELGYMSGMAAAALTQPDASNYRALRCNALAMAYVPFQYRGASTFRVPDIMTDAATYSGLGTGRTSGITTYATGGVGNIATPTAHVFGTEADWYLDGQAQFFIDTNHIPSCDYVYADMLEPRVWYGFDIALPFAIGANCVLPVAYRNSTWDGVTFNCGSFGTENNIRSHAWVLRGWRAVAMSMRKSIVAGTYGEWDMAQAVFASNTALGAKMVPCTNPATPNLKAMGIMPFGLDSSGFANWQYSLYWTWEVVLLEAHTGGEMSAVVDFMKPYYLALGGQVPGTATGIMDPTQGGGYYALIKSKNGSGVMDAPDIQWNAYGHGVNSITVNATNNTITATLQANIPTGSAPIANGDFIVFLEDAAGGSVMGGLSFDTKYLVRDLSLAGLVATIKLELTSGSGAIDITNTTFSNAWMVVHHQAAKSSGFWNNDQDGVAATKDMAGVYAMAWARSGMNAALAATDTAMSNAQGPGTEPDVGSGNAFARYCLEKTLCEEAA